jgi:hypothetical protein
VSERPKLGEIVLRAGVIDEMQLDAALGEQKKLGERLGQVLVRLGYVGEQELVQALASQLNLPVATLDGKKIPQRVLDLVPIEFAHEHTCIPLFQKEEEGVETLYVGLDNPSNLDVLDDLAFRTGMCVKPVVVATSEITSGIDLFYLSSESVELNAEPDSSRQPIQDEILPPDFATAPIVDSRDTNPFDDNIVIAVDDSSELPELEVELSEDSSELPELAVELADDESELPELTAEPDVDLTDELSNEPASEPASEPTSEPTAELAGKPIHELTEESSEHPSELVQLDEEIVTESNEAPELQAELVEDETSAAPATNEPSTRLILHALTQILIEKGIMSREEFQQRINALSQGDEGDHDES